MVLEVQAFDIENFVDQDYHKPLVDDYLQI